MDLRQLSRVVAAHKGVAAVGVVAALALAFLAQVRVDPFGSPRFTYRKPVVWSSSIVLQLTQEGFQEGRVSTQGSPVANFSPLYARLATTNPVRARMKKHGPVLGGVKVQPLTDDNRAALPFITISSYAFQPSTALTRAKRQADAFIAYVAAQQRINNVRARNRVILRVVTGPTPPFVVVPRKKTLPVVVFVAMLVVTGGLILALENARSRGAARPENAETPRAPLEALKSPEDASVSVQESVAGAMPETRAPLAASDAGRSGPTRTLRGDAASGGAGGDQEAREAKAAASRRAAESGGRSFGPPRG